MSDKKNNNSLLRQERARLYLTTWQAALTACSRGETFIIGKTGLQEADLELIRKNIAYWQATLAKAETA